MSTEAYSIEEAAQILDCTSETAVGRIECGDLPGLKIGRSWIVPCEAFKQRLNEMALESAQERRKQRQATTTTAKVISKARAPKAKAGRARTPPALPSLPALGTSAPPNPRP